MRQHTTPVPALGRQMTLAFEACKLEGLSEKEREKAVLTLAKVLMQGAGLVVEEFGDDQH